MFLATDTSHSPWHVVNSDSKKEARLNCISHLLSVIPYKKIPFKEPKIKKSIDSKHTPMKYDYCFVPKKF